MKAHFSVGATVKEFADWVNVYGETFFRKATGFWYVPHGYEDDPNGDGWIIDTHAPKGFVRFRIRADTVEHLAVQAVTLNQSLAPSEDDELNAYFAELVRAIRSKWEPVKLTLAELREQSFRRIEAGERKVDVYRSFYLPNLPDNEKPRDASHEADIHNAFDSAMQYRKERKG